MANRVPLAGVNVLRSLSERLALLSESPPDLRGSDEGRSGKDTVFLVHGHNDGLRQTVARFLEKVKGPKVVILDEQPDKGRTVIEKFVDYASSAGYAVVLVTGDDEGRLRGTEEWRRRARQNVILELGFFIGALGRPHVALLYEEGVELPSDIEGVLYLALDDQGAWKFKLAREMRAAGIDLDADALLSA